MKPKPILARATVNLADLRAGFLYWVDPRSDFVNRCLAAGYLVPEEETP